MRYFLGAQVDVSGLLKDCSGLESLSRLVRQRAEIRQDGVQDNDVTNQPDQLLAIKALSETFSAEELDVIRKNENASFEPEYKIHDTEQPLKAPGADNVYIADESGSDSDDLTNPSSYEEYPKDESHLKTGNLAGVYKDVSPRDTVKVTYRTYQEQYLLVRPAPSLRILFASPSMREAGLLQTPLLNRIGGSSRMRQDLDLALRASKPVTARVRWLRTASEDGDGEGNTRWIHCTPLLHLSNQPGLWMIVVVPHKEAAGSVYSSDRSTSDMSTSKHSSRTRGPSKHSERSRPGSRR